MMADLVINRTDLALQRPNALTTGAPSVGGGASGAGGSGWLIVSDVTVSGGSADPKTYQDTAQTVIETATPSAVGADLEIRSSYPLVSIDNGADQELTRDAGGGFYQGTLAHTLAGTGSPESVTIQCKTADGTLAAEHEIDLTFSGPPAVTAAVFTGGYPGSQTELKQGDTFSLQVTADKAFDRVTVAAFGAAEAGVFPVASTTSTTVSVVIADQGDSAQLLAARVSVRDATSGAESATYDTDTAGAVDGTNVVSLNNLYPSVSVGSVTYPATQSALKNVEVATVANTASDYDTIAYDDPTAAQITPTSPTLFQNPKTVTRIGGTYNVTTNNFRVTANRAANDATTVDQGVVNIAAVAPVVDVSVPAARLRSGGNDGTSAQDHTVTITADQQLGSAPTLLADAGGNRGAFQGGGFAGGPTVWTRSLRVDEGVPDEKGTFAFAGLVATNLAGIVQSTINSGAGYTLGGFVSRTVTVPAFAASVTFGVEVVDFSKVTAGNFSPGGASSKQPIGTVADTVNGYTIDAVSVNPTTLELLDLAAIAANSLGLYNLSGLEESV